MRRPVRNSSASNTRERLPRSQSAPTECGSHQHQLMALTGHVNEATAVAFSPDGNRLVSSGPDAVRIWDVSAAYRPEVLDAAVGANWGGQGVRQLMHPAQVRSVALAPDGWRV